MFFKGTITDTTYGRAVRTLIFTSAKRLKRHLEHTNLPSTHFVRTVHVLNEVNNALVIPPSRIGCATYHIYYKIFHICLQLKIGFRRSRVFRDVQD